MGRPKGNRANYPTEYSSYYSARTRCINPRHHNYRLYGGRGVQFLFASFEQFYAEVGPRPKGCSLDRIDPNGNYEVGNVRWATPVQQARNVRPEVVEARRIHMRRIQRLSNTEEIRQQFRVNRLGRKLPPEVVANMRLNYWEKRKGSEGKIRDILRRNASNAAIKRWHKEADSAY